MSKDKSGRDLTACEVNMTMSGLEGQVRNGRGGGSVLSSACFEERAAVVSTPSGDGMDDRELSSSLRMKDRLCPHRSALAKCRSDQGQEIPAGARRCRQAGRRL